MHNVPPQRARRRGRDGVQGNRIQVDPIEVEWHAARLDTLQIEQVANQAVEAQRLTVDVGRELLDLLDAKRLVADQLAQGLDAGQRSPELVRGERDEVALVPALPLEQLVGLRQ